MALMAAGALAAGCQTAGGAHSPAASSTVAAPSPAAPTAAALTAAAPCGSEPVSLAYPDRAVNFVHIYTGSDGVSHAEVQPHPAKESTYLGALLRQYALGDPSNAVIVSGPPNFRIPAHPAPYREIFVLLAGSSTVELSDGTQQALRPGSVVLTEDLTGPGHGGLFGPCGYVAIDLQFKPSG